jgi:hypothetical protein
VSDTVEATALCGIDRVVSPQSDDELLDTIERRRGHVGATRLA